MRRERDHQIKRGGHRRKTEGRLEVVIVKCESNEGGEGGQEVAVSRDGTMLSLCMFLNQPRRATSFPQCRSRTRWT